MDRTSFDRIGLVFSGGGFRATLHHLGVVRFLREQGLLGNLRHICSVSGGSITGAHLVLNWERYNGTAAEFQAAADELVAFTQTDLRGTIVRSWLFSYVALGIPRLFSPDSWSRTSLCQAKYSQLFRKAKLSELNGSDESPRPGLHLLSTSMTTGDLVSFSGDGVHIENEDSSVHIEQDDLPVALGVAASSAFPPLFAPVPLLKERIPELECDHYLTDGGVFDNLGIRKLLWLHSRCNEQFDLAIVSRAERDTPDEHDNPYPFIVQRASRSTDLMMERISWFERDSIARLEEEAGCEIITCQLTDTADQDHAGLSFETQAKVQTVRTDLDAFSDDEVNGLVRHGYALAKQGFSQVEQQDPTEVAWWPGKHSGANTLELASSHKTRLGLFHANDWSSWAILLLLLLYVGIPVGYVTANTLDLRQQIADKEAEEKEREKERKKQWQEAQRRARERREVDAGVQLVEGLTQLLVSSSYQQFDIAKEKWKKDVERYRKDPEIDAFYKQLLDPAVDPMKSVLAGLADATEKIEKKGDDEAVIDVLMTDKKTEGWQEKVKSPMEVSFKRIAIGFSHRIRNHILAAEDDKTDYLEILQGHRTKLYDEARFATSEIIKWRTNGNSPDDVMVSRNRFRVLYWGPLAMVEGYPVARAMVDFGYCLEAWEGLNSNAQLATLESMEAAKGALDDQLDTEDEETMAIEPW